MAGNNEPSDNIGRVATLLQDLFDGRTTSRGQNVPTNGDAWTFDDSTSHLIFNVDPAGDGIDDNALERVALPGRAIRIIFAGLASRMEPFIEYNFDDAQWEAAGYAIDDMKLRAAVDSAMIDAGVSWCDRCRVLALHEPGANTANVRALRCRSMITCSMSIRPRRAILVRTCWS